MAMNDEFYTASDVARLSGATLRSIRYWALTQVLEATPESDRAGTGKHRQFNREEIVIACIIQYFAERGLQVGQLTSLSRVIRGHFAIVGIQNSVKDAIRNDAKLYMIVPDRGGIALISEKFLPGNCDQSFLSLTNESPGFIAVLLNGLFSRLRSEWT
jgi:hypothetical protein